MCVLSLHAAHTILTCYLHAAYNTYMPEEVGHIISCMALRQSCNTWPLQSPVQLAESADHYLRTTKTIHTDVIKNVCSQ